jgi:putative phosphoribosyl transferase
MANMTAKIVEDPKLRDRFGVFQNRREAGEYLARFLERCRGRDGVVFAIPSGGIPIGLAISKYLDLPLDLLIIRKIPIPGNPEAGFGAISLEEDLVLNQPLVRMLRLSAEDIEELSKPVRRDLEERNRLFRENRPWPDLQGRIVVLVDDGLASGYTMMAAVRMVRRREPSQIIVAVPTASWSTIRLLSEEVDVIMCPNIRTGFSFAVADAYMNWYDLSRSEVIELLREHDLLPHE